MKLHRHLLLPGTDKFFEASLEDAKLSTSSGKTGGKARVNEKEFPSAAPARKEWVSKVKKKFREGYMLIDPSAALGDPILEFHFSKNYTGFMSMAYSAEEKLLALGKNLENRSCELRLVEIPSGETKATWTFPNFDIAKLCFIDEGRMLLQFDRDVMVFDRASGNRELLASGEYMSTVRFSYANGKLLAQDKMRFMVLDLESGKEIFEFPLTNPEESGHRRGVSGVLSPDGSKVAISQVDGRIELYDLEANAAMSPIEGDFTFAIEDSFQFDPTGKQILFNEHYGASGIRLFDIESGDPAEMMEEFVVSYPDGKTFPVHGGSEPKISGRNNYLVLNFSSTAQKQLAFYDREELVERFRIYGTWGARRFSYCLSPEEDLVFLRADTGFISVYSMEIGDLEWEPLVLVGPSDVDKQIEALMEKSDALWDEGDELGSLKLMEDAWDLMPEPKGEYEDVFNHVRTLGIAYLDKGMLEKARHWSELLYDCGKNRADSGQRELLSGQISLAEGNEAEAWKYFDASYKKSKMTLKRRKELWAFYQNYSA